MYKKRLQPLLMLLVLASGISCLLQLAAFIVAPSSAVAASPAVPSDATLPPHAKWQSWGNGWECQRGYRKEDQRCIEIDVPPHAFLDVFGHDWECERSYRREGERCVPVQVPEHAHLDITGHDWECQRGYRKEDQRCIEVDVPPHAFLDAIGHDWECERGYRREGGRCVPVQVPEHAHLAYSGHGWTCNDGYQRVDQACEPLLGETLTQTTSAKGELTQLATQVYANREASHDRQTIKHLQRQLRQTGYNPGPSDGILGPRTLAALRQFLTDHGLAVENMSQDVTSSVPDS